MSETGIALWLAVRRAQGTAFSLAFFFREMMRDEHGTKYLWYVHYTLAFYIRGAKGKPCGA